MKKLGIIGCGNMGSAIVKNLKGIDIIGFDLNRDKVESLEIEVAESIDDLISGSDVVLLAIKPQTYREMSLNLDGKIVVSIMAGVALSDLPERAVRVMPNFGATVGESVSSWVCSASIVDEDKAFIRELLESFGVQIEVGSDDEIDKMTALIGSGPAYLYKFMKALVEKGEALGFDKALVRKAVDGLVDGSSKAAKGEDLDDMISRVASKGGTTEAALNILGAKWGDTLKEAVDAAYDRAKELGR